MKSGAGKNRIYCSWKCARLDRKSNGFICQQGYRKIQHNCKSVFEHRLIVEQALGRTLKKTEVVHHNNWNKLDNRIENLTVMSQKCHRSLTDYLARLWVGEHMNEVNEVTKDFTITFTAGG